MKYTRYYEGGELAGYESEKGRIIIEYGNTNWRGNRSSIDYIVEPLRIAGKPCLYHRLRDAKAELESFAE